jgi:hypothetical protein
LSFLRFLILFQVFLRSILSRFFTSRLCELLKNIGFLDFWMLCLNHKQKIFKKILNRNLMVYYEKDRKEKFLKLNFGDRVYIFRYNPGEEADVIRRLMTLQAIRNLE